MSIERGAGGAKSPLDFEIISKKTLVFQFRGVKTKFHHFCPPPGKDFGKTPTGPPLEKILPTPMNVVLYQVLRVNGNGLLFHMTQLISKSNKKAIAY